MANNKKGNLWILILVCIGCIIISTVAYVVMKARMQSHEVLRPEPQQPQIVV